MDGSGKSVTQFLAGGPGWPSKPTAVRLPADPAGRGPHRVPSKIAPRDDTRRRLRRACFPGRGQSMVCYVPGTGTLAVLGFAVYLVWHRAIMHFFSMVGLAMEVTLLLSTEVAVAIFLIWTARMIRRRRAAAGACTTCRFRCQEALAPRPNFFVNRVDRRVSPPPPVRRPALTCHPAAPILPVLPFRAGRRLRRARLRPSRRLPPCGAGAVPRFRARACSRCSAGAAARCSAGAAARCSAGGAGRCSAGGAGRCSAGGAGRCSAGAAARCSAGAAARCSTGAAPRCSTGGAFRCTAPGTRSPAGRGPARARRPSPPLAGCRRG